MNVEITEPAILFHLKQTYQPTLTATELYEATRKSWRIAPEKRPIPPRFAFAVYGDIIQQVYEIERWQTAPGYVNRLLFDGQVATEKSHYIGQTVSWFKRGSTNPVKYLNCDPVGK